MTCASKNFVFRWLWILTFMLAIGALPVWADAIDDIQQRETLVVGVQTDVPAFGMLDKQIGHIVGFEPDLARDLADRLGVKLELVDILFADRAKTLIDRQVDLVIAQFSQTPEREQILTFVSPAYYESGAGVLARRSEGFKHWSELRNRRVCSLRGSFYNRLVTVDYGVDIVFLYSMEIALESLRAGRCDGLLGDSVIYSVLLQAPDFAEHYEMTLPVLYQTEWAIALHADERGGRLESMISSAIWDWHRSGLLKRLEDRWNIPRNPFVEDMFNRYSAQTRN